MTQSTKDAAISVWQAFASREPESIRNVLSDDCAWSAPPNNATQVALGLQADMLETREGIISFLVDHFRRLFPEGARFEFTKVVADGDTVVFEQRMRATTVNGRSYDNRYCWVFEMEGPRVRRIREYMDTHGGYAMLFGAEAPRTLVV